MKLFTTVLTCAALLGCGPNASSSPGQQKTSSDQEKLVQIEAMFNDYQKSFKDVPFIDPRDDISTAELIFIDVRESKEQEVSMITGAITKEEFEKNQDKYKNKKIIVYCTIGYRSGLYTRILRAKGFDASNMKSGILLWAHAGKTVSDKNGPTKKVHVYGQKWNLLPSGWESIF